MPLPPAPAARVRDDETVAAAKTGDPEAWQELYAAHAGRLLVWLGSRRLPDSATSPEDIASEAWLVAARRLPDFEGTAEEFAGWLFGIARKVAANHTRRSAHLPSGALDADQAERHSEPTEGPDALVPAVAWVRSVLAELPPRERDVLACMEVVGLDTAATARALQMSQVAVRVARHRGLRRLRERLQPAGASAPLDLQG